MKLFLNIILLPLHLAYLLIVSIRNYLYDIKLFKITKLPCKVISVGNITMGGTGKTPTVIAIAQNLQKQNMSVAILSRGYGRSSSGTQLVTDGETVLTDWQSVGDEPILMADKLNEIPIVVDEKRFRGGKYLVNNFNPDIILLDDGFQHRKLYRDLDIVLINGTAKLNNSPYFNFLKFREPLSTLKRANIIFISKSNLSADATSLSNMLTKYGKPIYKTTLQPANYLRNKNGNRINLSSITDKNALIFSGVGDKMSFNTVVQKLGFTIVEEMHFRDHHKYSDRDIHNIKTVFTKNKAGLILTTEKDLVKIGASDLPIYAIPVTINIEAKCFEEHIL